MLELCLFRYLNLQTITITRRIIKSDTDFAKRLGFKDISKIRDIQKIEKKFHRH